MKCFERKKKEGQKINEVKDNENEIKKYLKKNPKSSGERRKNVESKYGKTKDWLKEIKFLKKEKDEIKKEQRN